MTISYRMIKSGEESAVSSFVLEVFNEFVAPLFAEEGVEEFNRYTSADAITGRIENGNMLLVAEAEDEIVGIIEVRENNHVGWLFVDKRFQRTGVGRHLLKNAVELCKERDNTVNRITVNSSPNAVAAYRRFGFRAVEDEKTVNGIRHTPMELTIDAKQKEKTQP